MCLHGTGKQCDGETTRVFARGHDARMASRVATAVAAEQMTPDAAEKLIRDAGGGDQLVSKMQHSAQLRIDKNAAPSPDGKAATSTAKKGKQDAKAAATSEPQAQEGTRVGDAVPVTHGNKTSRAVIVRNAAEELVARHRFQGKNCDHPIET
jgi:hypothetical protein